MEAATVAENACSTISSLTKLEGPGTTATHFHRQYKPYLIPVREGGNLINQHSCSLADFLGSSLVAQRFLWAVQNHLDHCKKTVEILSLSKYDRSNRIVAVQRTFSKPHLLRGENGLESGSVLELVNRSGAEAEPGVKGLRQRAEEGRPMGA